MPHRTIVKFEVVGVDVADLWRQAEMTIKQVAGPEGTWDLSSNGPAEGYDSVWESSVGSVPRKVITLWKQPFKGTVDFQ